MRLIRSLLILVAAGFAVAGCALPPTTQVPVSDAAMNSPPPSLAASRSADSGIDTTVYGSTRATGSIGASVRMPATAQASQGSPDVDRGLFMAADSEPSALTVPATATANAPPAAAGPYRLDSGDRLRIVVFGQDGLSNSYLVDASGYIDMPLIGTVSARDETTEQLSKRIGERLRQGYVRDPHVAVEIEAYRPFFILGEVAQPGQYPYVADMTVETAVAIAGGFGPRAFRRTVTITRIVDGQRERMTVPASFPLRPGDTVNVHERWF
jgi:polysaccharide biosynthesis/export protein